jgi:hypothetical protein
MRECEMVGGLGGLERTQASGQLKERRRTW